MESIGEQEPEASSQRISFHPGVGMHPGKEASVSQGLVWFPLRFHAKTVENAFVQHFRAMAFSFRRIAFLAGLLTFTVFGVLDPLLAGGRLWQVWAIRFGVIVPALALGWLISNVERLKPYLGYVSFASLVLAGLGLTGIIDIAPEPGAALYFESLLLLIPFGVVFLRLRTVASFASAVIIMVVFTALSVGRADMGSVRLVVSVAYLAAATVAGSTIAYLLEQDARQAFLLTEQLNQASIVDPLTSLYNRRWLDQTLAKQVSRFRRYGTPFSLILIDLDGFKSVNDTHGYLTGDRLLVRIGQLIISSVRRADEVFRYGGDEFVILAPSTGAQASLGFVERIRTKLGRESFADLQVDQKVEFSAGIAEATDSGQDGEDLFQLANQALQRAKSGGKGETFIAEPAAKSQTQRPTKATGETQR